MKHFAKRSVTALAALTLMASAMMPSAFAAEAHSPETSPAVCYPTSVNKSDDLTQVKKIYDLSADDDPAGIPCSDFEQDGYHYTMVELLKQELPENESRYTTETISVSSPGKDMGTVLSLLPQEKEFVTDDGLIGVLTLKLDTVDIKVAGYGTSTKDISASRTYPNLESQDTSYIPKEIEDNGNSLTLQSVDWQSDGGSHFNAIAVYSGKTTNSYVKGYTVTADYAGTVSRINLNKVRYVAIFEGEPLEGTQEEAPTEPPVVDEPISEPAEEPKVNKLPLVLGGGAIGVAVGALVIAFVKRRG